MLTSISASMSSGAASHEAVERTGRRGIVDQDIGVEPAQHAQHGLAVRDVERQRPAAGLARELAELVGRAGDGVDVEPAIVSWRTVAAPMPRLAPVTMAVR